MLWRATAAMQIVGAFRVGPEAKEFFLADAAVRKFVERLRSAKVEQHTGQIEHERADGHLCPDSRTVGKQG